MGGKGGSMGRLDILQQKTISFWYTRCDSLCRWYPKGLIVYVFGTHGFDSLCALNFKKSSVELTCLEALSKVLSFKDCEILDTDIESQLLYVRSCFQKETQHHNDHGK